MLTIDLELEKSLQAIAQREHSSPNEIIKKLISQYITEKKSSELVTDIVKDLPEFPCFANQDPLQLQRSLRDEWN
ncbi:MAG: hypothetical protein COZ20_00575 [Gallionellales bacterium CG_4_10_14_3_um_filter_54_96]|nr:MAG: hypothetical protein COS43_02340 [Gallionellales bacterium CG03_land_8_20_14_0_80_55_15]PIV92103.1 MAG: hypothetical protein COW45_01540 [Gallionellales bacterium CG17_big_fil_post_rev_8_21_14_2_50_54_146]PIX04432.1 MAG: hypothetical protein COZ77_06525 [Gallionellales bacterium CG_4_8_14_3_um_filter_54_18]PIY06984.1 MAG: hypothetical protein COZ20_00575 [Gallionellales bacterium CG_4_10_14_3_um_filter_54_96]HCJ51595.1 hypothetical protein [Gallionella sp.]